MVEVNKNSVVSCKDPQLSADRVLNQGEKKNHFVAANQ